MAFKIIITLLALAPNLLIGYLFLNKDAIIEKQKGLVRGFVWSGCEVDKQTEDIKGNMGSMFTDTIKPEIKAGDKKTKTIPSTTGPALPFSNAFDT